MSARQTVAEENSPGGNGGSEPRAPFAWAALTYCLAILPLAYPAFAGGFLVSRHSDQYIAGYAFREFAASFLRTHGAFPQWNPYLFGGMPYIAAMHGDTFYPTFLLRMLLPTDVAMTWGFIVHLILAGLFTFGFLRSARLSFAGAVLGGLAYMLSGQLASLVSPGHDGKLFVSALFPLVLWMLVLWVRDGRRWAPGLLAVVVGLAVLSPHPQLVQYLMLAAGSYALFLAVRGARATAFSRGVAAKRLAVAFGAVALGALIGAVQYLPVREYVAWSPRSGGIRDYATATSYAWPPSELLDVYLPQFSGILESYWGQNGIHFHSQYVGVAVLVLAFAAFVGARRDPRRSEIWFWTGALVVALLWSFGGHTPFYRIPYTLVPGTRFFRAPATVFFVGAMAIAFFAAVGSERFLAQRVGKRYLLGWVAVAAVIAVLASAGVLTAVAESLAQPEAMDRVSANTAAITVGAWRSFLFVALTAGLLFVAARRNFQPRLVLALVAVILTADAWSVLRHYWGFSPRASQLYAADPTIEYLRAQPQPARTLALQLAPSDVNRDANLVGDGLMVHRVRTTLGYHGNQLARYDALAGRERGYDQLANPQLWNLTNTQFLLSNVDSLPLAGAVRVAGPARTAAGSSVSLFRLPGEQPYAWVTPVIVKAGDEAVLSTVLDSRFDIRAAALFDTSAAVTAASNVTALPAPLAIRARVARYEPGRVSIVLDAGAPPGAALVVSENYYPGWRASVDGKPATIGRADYSLIGVQLPVDARAIELVFESAAYERGKLVTLVALGAALMWTAAAALSGRRQTGRSALV